MRRGLLRRASGAGRRLGIDEQSSLQPQPVVTMVVAREQKTGRHVADDRHAGSLAAYVRGRPLVERTGLEALAMDRWAPSRHSGRRWVPDADATIVFDRCHRTDKMKTATSYRTLLSSAAILVGWSWLIAPQCSDPSGPGGPPPPPIQHCDVTYDTDFPTGCTVSLNKPANCPIKVPGVTTVPYAATATLPNSGNLVYGQYEAHVIDRNGLTSSIFVTTAWSTGSGTYLVSVSGDYYAAQGSFDSYNQGYDNIQNRFYIGAGRWTSGTIKIAYSLGSPSNYLTAPSGVDAGMTYSVSAYTDDPLMVSPLTWSWYVDGAAGTTSDGGFSVQAGAPSTTQEISAYAPDATGRSAYGVAHVWARSNCVDIYGNPANCQ